jgi:magnesium-transporting ATPase (P-type)
MFIRDLNTNDKNPQSKDDNLVVIMKGAPDRIFGRCSKILINGEEKEFDDFMRAEV